MNVLSICVLSVVAVIMALTIKPKNSEISLMILISASAIILLSMLSSVSSIISEVNSIVATASISTGYIVILLKVIGICLVTEFAVNVCKDAGSQALAGNVSLVGKILITITALPLYRDILNTVLSLTTT